MSEIFDKMMSGIAKGLERSDRELVVVGLGGLDSWGTLVAACDEVTPTRVMSVTVHSPSHTSTKTEPLMRGLANSLGVAEHVSVDIGETVVKMMNARQGVGRVETECVGYNLDVAGRCELVSLLRRSALRSIATKYDAVLACGINLSKIQVGWCNACVGPPDINPLHNVKLDDLREALEDRGLDTLGILDEESKLDLLPDGSPFWVEARSDGPERSDYGSPLFGRGIFYPTLPNDFVEAK